MTTLQLVPKDTSDAIEIVTNLLEPFTEPMADSRPSHVSVRRWNATYHRDHVWLTWQDEELEPPAIRKRWNALPASDRERLAKNTKASAKATSNQVVWVGLAKAATERAKSKLCG